jgi:hypothetical protein
VARGQAFVDGINAYVDTALIDPKKMPAEYTAIGKAPTPAAGRAATAAAGTRHAPR